MVNELLLQADAVCVALTTGEGLTGTVTVCELLHKLTVVVNK
jgi:hypothetical protein